MKDYEKYIKGVRRQNVIDWCVLLFVLISLVGLTIFNLGCQTTRIVNTPLGPRDYGLYVPRDLPPHPVPLVVLNHFAILNNEATIHVTRFDQLAEKEKFLVATTKADGPFFLPTDIPYLRSVINDVRSKHLVSKIYMVGLSNGGGLTQLAACNGFNLDGIALVGAAQLEIFNEGCDGYDEPIKTIIIHGTDDPIVSYTGGRFYGFANLLPVVEVVNYWVGRNKASAPQNYEAIPDINLADGSHASIGDYSGDFPVRHIIIHDGGHTYPGYDSSFIPGAGNTNMDFDATEMIWEFFNG